jgi:hypothetical protein
MGKSKKREPAAEMLGDVRQEGETWEKYGKRMARETPVPFELIPPPPTLTSAEEAGHYMLGTMMDALCYLEGTYKGEKPDSLLWDLYAAVSIIRRYLTEGWQPPVEDNRMANLAELAALSFEGLERYGCDEDHESFYS